MYKSFAKYVGKSSYSRRAAAGRAARSYRRAHSAVNTALSSTRLICNCLPANVFQGSSARWTPSCTTIQLAAIRRSDPPGTGSRGAHDFYVYLFGSFPHLQKVVYLLLELLGTKFVLRSYPLREAWSSAPCSKVWRRAASSNSRRYASLGGATARSAPVPGNILRCLRPAMP